MKIKRKKKLKNLKATKEKILNQSKLKNVKHHKVNGQSG
jgi:hypothetical protein